MCVRACVRAVFPCFIIIVCGAGGRGEVGGGR